MKRKITVSDYSIKVITQNEDPNKIQAIRGTVKSIDANQFRDTYENMFRIDLTPELHNIQKKIDSKAIKFGKIFAASWGARGVPVEKFHLDSPINKHCKKMVKGGNVERYGLSYSEKWLLYDVKKLYRPSMPEFFENNKVIFQKVTGEHGLIGVFDNQKYYTDDSLICCIPKYRFEGYDENKLHKHKIYIQKEEIESSKNYNILYVLTVMNSQVNGFYFSKFVGYALNVYPENIEYLPMPLISFTTPEKERKEFFKEAVKLYERSKYEDI
ncbi:MAG: TaqI-like C-terminal specificity domain-containing protein, partial [Nanoarchaeota archaeon]